MKIAKLTPFLSVSPQIAEADLGALAAQGFRAVVNNRPDLEAEDQPAGAALAAAAERVGLEYRHVPVVSGSITDDDVAAFAAALDEIKGPVLAFCRTGTRSTTLWALAEARHLDPQAILATAAEAGYDLAALEPHLEVRFRTTEPGARPRSGGRVHPRRDP
jgi:sulfide:quinone oxidoreductase